MLKPFEMYVPLFFSLPYFIVFDVKIALILVDICSDLLTRVHEDLSRRIGAVHDELRSVRGELRSLIGVLVPDLKTALDEQAARQIHLLAVPADLAGEFEDAFRLHPACVEPDQQQYPTLRDMADAFIYRLDRSTVGFVPGLTVSERIPGVEQYLNLLKCVFLIKKMREAVELREAGELSHWPSYVMELEEVSLILPRSFPWTNSSLDLPLLTEE